MSFKDPATIFVVCVLIAFIGFVIAARISSDKADLEEKMKKEKEQEGKKKA